MFDCQSWLLVHMLRQSPEFSPRFNEFFQSVADGEESAAALLRIHRLSPEDLIRKWRQWLALTEWKTEPLDPPDHVQIRIMFYPAPEDAVKLVEATLAAAALPATERASVYDRMAHSLGGSCSNHMPLGDLALNLGLKEQAAKHYEDAVRCGIPSAQVSREMAPAGGKASVLTEDLVDEIEAITRERSVRASWAEEMLHREDYEGVLQATEDLSGMSRDAVRLAWRVRAAALHRLGRVAEAAERATRLAESLRADFELRYVELGAEDSESRRIRGVAGVLTRVDCMGPMARLHVRTAEGRDLRLLVAEASDVMVDEGGEKKIELQCGPQNLPAGIGYVEEKNESTGTEGRVRYFRLRQ